MEDFGCPMGAQFDGRKSDFPVNFESQRRMSASLSREQHGFPASQNTAAVRRSPRIQGIRYLASMVFNRLRVRRFRMSHHPGDAGEKSRRDREHLLQYRLDSAVLSALRHVSSRDAWTHAPVREAIAAVRVIAPDLAMNGKIEAQREKQAFRENFESEGMLRAQRPISCAYLVSLDFATGQVIVMDGSMVMHRARTASVR